MDYQTAKGWLREEEREYLYSVALALRPAGLIVNIGVEYGASMVCFRQGAPHVTLVGIDLDMSKFEELYPDFNAILLRGDSWFHLRNISFIMDHVWLTREIDVLFVDGDHSHAGVIRDSGYADHVKSGGLVIFHDCFDYEDPSIGAHRVCPGVNRAVSDWFDKYKADWEELTSVGTMRIFKRK